MGEEDVLVPHAHLVEVVVPLHAPGKIGDDAAAVVGDDLEVGEAFHDPAVAQPEHRH